MAKLRLDLDELQVESFDTSSRPRPLGTVRGHGITEGDSCDTVCQSCDTCGTLDESCDSYCLSCWGGAGCGDPQTYDGSTCESTCHQKACGCTYGARTCDYTCQTCGVYETCQSGCPTRTTCPTERPYPGC